MFHSNTFRFWSTVILTNDFKKISKKYDIIFKYANCICGEDTIVFSTKIKKNDLHGAIAHECYHLVKNAVRVRGINDEETEAYLLTWLVNKTTKFLNSK